MGLLLMGGVVCVATTLASSVSRRYCAVGHSLFLRGVISHVILLITESGGKTSKNESLFLPPSTIHYFHSSIRLTHVVNNLQENMWFSVYLFLQLT